VSDVFVNEFGIRLEGLDRKQDFFGAASRRGYWMGSGEDNSAIGPRIDYTSAVELNSCACDR